MNGPQKATIGALVADTAIVSYRAAKSPTANYLPPPAEFPLIILLYGVLVGLSGNDTYGRGFAAFAWLITVASSFGFWEATHPFAIGKTAQGAPKAAPQAKKAS
jgi:hypothetical protein